MSDDEDAFTEQDYQELDPGIREVVRLLRCWNFNTTDSGDGVSKRGTEAEACMIDQPHVVVITSPDKMIDECDRLVAVLRQTGVKLVPIGRLTNDAYIHIQASYDPIDQSASIVLFGLDDEMLTSARACVTAH